MGGESAMFQQMHAGFNHHRQSIVLEASPVIIGNILKNLPAAQFKSEMWEKVRRPRKRSPAATELQT